MSILEFMSNNVGLTAFIVIVVSGTITNCAKHLSNKDNKKD